MIVVYIKNMILAALACRSDVLSGSGEMSQKPGVRSGLGSACSFSALSSRLALSQHLLVVYHDISNLFFTVSQIRGYIFTYRLLFISNTYNVCSLI